LLGFWPSARSHRSEHGVTLLQHLNTVTRMNRLVQTAICEWLVLGGSLLTFHTTGAVTASTKSAFQAVNQQPPLVRTHSPPSPEFGTRAANEEQNQHLTATLGSRASIALVQRQPLYPPPGATPAQPAATPITGTSGQVVQQAVQPAAGSGQVTNEVLDPAPGSPNFVSQEPVNPTYTGTNVAEPLSPVGPAYTGTQAEAPAIGQQVIDAEKTDADKKYGNYSGVVHYNLKVKGTGHFLRQDETSDAIIKCVNTPIDDDAYARFRMVERTDGRWGIRNTATHHYMWEYVTDREVRGTSSVTDTFTSFELEPQADWSYRLKVLGSKHYLHEDVDTGVLAGGNVTNDMGSFILVPLECCEECKAYQFESVCPPDRCSWVGDHCEGIRKPAYVPDNAAHHGLWAVAVAGVLATLLPSTER